MSETSLTSSRVVFIGGSGRSGSTLIERLLGELPSVCNVGEVVHLWERGLLRGETCGCGTPFPACPFWARVGEVAFGGWDQLDVARFLEVKSSVDRNRHIFRLAASRRPGGGSRRGQAERPGEASIGGSAAAWTSAEPATVGGLPSRARWYADTYARLYAAIAQVSGCQVVVDSSKHASLAFCLHLSADIDLRIVHVVRDSRAVAYSWTKRIRRPEAAADSDEFMPTFSPIRSAMLWNTLNLGFGLLSALGVPVRQIRYEDFVADPPVSLAELAEFACGPGDFTEVIAGFLARDQAKLGRSHTASGNPMRFATGSIAFRADQAWREALHPRDRAVVLALTLPLLARYGYLRRPATAAGPSPA